MNPFRRECSREAGLPLMDALAIPGRLCTVGSLLHAIKGLVVIRTPTLLSIGVRYCEAPTISLFS
jgi:hypothetical protein